MWFIIFGNCYEKKKRSLSLLIDLTPSVTNDSRVAKIVLYFSNSVWIEHGITYNNNREKQQYFYHDFFSFLIFWLVWFCDRIPNTCKPFTDEQFGSNLKLSSILIKDGHKRFVEYTGDQIILHLEICTDWILFLCKWQWRHKKKYSKNSKQILYLPPNRFDLIQSKISMCFANTLLCQWILTNGDVNLFLLLFSV